MRRARGWVGEWIASESGLAHSDGKPHLPIHPFQLFFSILFLSKLTPAFTSTHHIRCRTMKNPDLEFLLRYGSTRRGETNKRDESLPRTAAGFLEGDEG